MRLTYVILVMVSLFLFFGCFEPKAPEDPDVMTVAELLENPVYDTPVKIYGEVGLLGEVTCTCFNLASGGQGITVWYDSMLGADEIPRPAVDMNGIGNGNSIIVTGELKTEEYSVDENDFWASNVEKVG